LNSFVMGHNNLGKEGASIRFLKHEEHYVLGRSPVNSSRRICL
jgi:hypothetical protein